jgi:homoserine kinase
MAAGSIHDWVARRVETTRISLEYTPARRIPLPTRVAWLGLGLGSAAAAASAAAATAVELSSLPRHVLSSF